MSTIGPALPPPAITPSYSPLGKPVVGLESSDAKNQTLPPVEESNRSDRNRDRSGARTDELSTDAERRKGGGEGSSPAELTDEQLQEVRELAAVDREVRAHEAAHAAVGGNLAGGPSFRFVTGPDGQRYAVGGEVPISLEVVPDDPAATLQNAVQVQAAALAPVQPSPQDLQVAAAAAQLIVESQLQLAARRATAANPQSTGRAGGDRPGAAAGAVNAFRQGAEDHVPGELLDQRA